MISPADGRVVMITDVDEPNFVHGKATRFSIFMNIFNVHVNRYPVNGTVKYVHYNPGKFMNAAAGQGEPRQRADVGRPRITAAPVLVRQIAGAIARRIVTYSKVGDSRRRDRVRSDPFRFARRRVRA